MHNSVILAIWCHQKNYGGGGKTLEFKKLLNTAGYKQPVKKLFSLFQYKRGNQIPQNRNPDSSEIRKFLVSKFQFRMIRTSKNRTQGSSLWVFVQFWHGFWAMVKKLDNCPFVWYSCNGWMVWSNGTTSLPESVPRFVLDKVRLVPVIQVLASKVHLEWWHPFYNIICPFFKIIHSLLK